MVIPKLITNIVLHTGGFYFGGFEMVSSYTQKIHALFRKCSQWESCFAIT